MFVLDPVIHDGVSKAQPQKRIKPVLDLSQCYPLLAEPQSNSLKCQNSVFFCSGTVTRQDRLFTISLPQIIKCTEKKNSLTMNAFISFCNYSSGGTLWDIVPSPGHIFYDISTLKHSCLCPFNEWKKGEQK